MLCAQENFDLQRQVQELDAALTTTSKARSSLQAQLDDLKKQLEDEIRVRPVPSRLSPIRIPISIHIRFDSCVGRAIADAERRAPNA